MVKKWHLSKMKYYEGSFCHKDSVGGSSSFQWIATHLLAKTESQYCFRHLTCPQHIVETPSFSEENVIKSLASVHFPFNLCFEGFRF